ncbi:MAG: hypothetical protein ONB51_11560 [candidate division KSB1 bacterium]|nr:hypothetical protein [candidate division KSB1 bacterium]MDZ7409858.1 hypothetical protein [candidate division KSB1 bacterium]
MRIHPVSRRLGVRTVVYCAVLFSCVRAPADSDDVVRYHRPQYTLDNAGFELGSVGWKPLAENLVGFTITSDSIEFTAGWRSLKIDLSRSRVFDGGSFRLVSPWLTLPGGGEFEFSAQVKAGGAGGKVALRVINGVAKQALRRGKQRRGGAADHEVISAAWTPVVLSGTLPVAEKDAYRLALEFEAPGVYWIDQIEFRHRGQSICAEAELTAGLQPVDRKTKLSAAPAQVPLQLWLANRTDRPRALKLQLHLAGRLHAGQDLPAQALTLAGQTSRRHVFTVPLAHADDYRLAWTLREAAGPLVAQGVLRLAAQNAQLPAATRGEAVWGMHLNAMNLEITLPLLRQAHVTYLRNVLQLYWSQVEPKPGKWQWPDELLAYLQEQGFEFLPILGFPPRWASVPARPGGSDLLNMMPRSLDEFRNYLREVTARYGSQITRWEIWNEPNLPRYFDGTPGDYGAVLAAAVSAFAQLQPQARLAGLSLAWSDDNLAGFVQQALTPTQARPQAISFHPYEKIAPEQALMEKIEQLRLQVRELCGYVPELWATETGYRGRDSINAAIPYYSPPRPTTVNEMTQAAYLVRHALLAKAAGVKYYFCYSMDSERSRSGPDVHGLLDYDPDASVKPALLAYLTLAQLCGDAVFERRQELDNPGQYLMHYRRADGRRFAALWQSEGTAVVTLPAALQGAEAWDFFGNRLTPASGKLQLDTRPVYFLH